MKTIIILITLVLMPVCNALEKVISTSPDGKVKILIQNYPKDQNAAGTNQLSHTLDQRNKGERIPLLGEPFVGKMECRWFCGSTVLSINYGEEKAWQSSLLILRIDAKSGIYFFQPPVLPNLGAIIHDRTKENGNLLVSENPSVPKFGPQLPQFEGSSVGMVGFDEKNPMPPNHFVVNYAELELNGSSGNGSTQEGGLVYHFLFETDDWVRFKLIKITRSGSPPLEAIYPDAKPDVPVTLYPQTSKPGDDKERKPAQKLAADGKKEDR